MTNPTTPRLRPWLLAAACAAALSPLAQAHSRVSAMEAAVRAELGGGCRVVSHIEPQGAHPEPSDAAADDPDTAETLRTLIADTVDETPGLCDLHGLTLLRSGARLADRA